jgi:hypothetical protein
MSKYYFITFITRRLGREYLDCDVISEHPFEWFKKDLDPSDLGGLES